ncbi:MAG: NAD(P)-dependent alcohol dehydrogenase [Pseudomonadota bacterium]
MRVVSLKQPGGLDNLTVVEQDQPTPGPHDILVRWHATSLNFHDYLVAKGAIPVAEGRIPMSDGAGEVVAVGDYVSSWQPGDKVMSLFFPNWQGGRPVAANTAAICGESVDGFAAEYSCVTENAVTEIPHGYSYAEAATLPCAAVTAWRALVVEGQMKSGDTVLVQGTGGVSLFGLQLAKAANATVIATSSSEEKLDKLRSMGAQHVINYKGDEKWGKTVSKLTSGGVDHVIDIGASATIAHSVDAVAYGGHITAVGILGGRKGQFDFPKLFFKHARITGVAVGSREMQQDMVKAIDVSSWKPVLDRSFTLEELADAFRHQESGAHFGKIVVEY